MLPCRIWLLGHSAADVRPDRNETPPPTPPARGGEKEAPVAIIVFEMCESRSPQGEGEKKGVVLIDAFRNVNPVAGGRGGEMSIASSEPHRANGGAVDPDFVVLGSVGPIDMREAPAAPSLLRQSRHFSCACFRLPCALALRRRPSPAKGRKSSESGYRLRHVPISQDCVGGAPDAGARRLVDA